MIKRLYQPITAIDKIDGKERYGVIKKKIKHLDNLFYLVKLYGFTNPQLTDDGEIMVEEGWKLTVYHETDLKILDEDFDFKRHDGFFNDDVWKERDPMHAEIMDKMV